MVFDKSARDLLPRVGLQINGVDLSLNFTRINEEQFRSIGVGLLRTEPNERRGHGVCV